MSKFITTHEVYETGTGQKLHVHMREQCQGSHCVIHNPSNHPMKNFPTHWRTDRCLMERICPHGIGHPDPDDVAFYEKVRADKSVKSYYSVHGCDGCCT